MPCLRRLAKHIRPPPYVTLSLQCALQGLRKFRVEPKPKNWLLKEAHWLLRTKMTSLLRLQRVNCSFWMQWCDVVLPSSLRVWWHLSSIPLGPTFCCRRFRGTSAWIQQAIITPADVVWQSTFHQACLNSAKCVAKEGRNLSLGNKVAASAPARPGGGNFGGGKGKGKDTPNASGFAEQMAPNRQWWSFMFCLQSWWLWWCPWWEALSQRLAFVRRT